MQIKTVKKEVEEYTGRWEELPGPWISRIKIVKVAMLSKMVYRVNATPSTFQCHSSQR
jgi:hypothetical protein